MNSQMNNMNLNGNTYTSQNTMVAPVVEKVLLPTRVIEKPVAVHEEIRQELVEEIQPIVEVEKFKTEIHQVTQPLFDRETKAVNLQQKTFATEILPEIDIPSRGINMQDDVSTTKYLNTKAVVIEKPAIFTEVDKTQIIEEIQPVIYKETVVPTVIQETKPIYQKIVEGPTYIQETLPSRDISGMMHHDRVVAPVVVERAPVVAVIEQPVIVERVTPVVVAAPVVAPVEHKKKGFHLPKFHKTPKNKMVETTTTTTTTVERPGLMVTNELLYADGANGHNTVLDGSNPFNRDYLLADNPITHNEFARQARDHHGDLKTAGPYLTSEPSLRGTHSSLVTPLGDGGAHFIDPKLSGQYAANTYEPARRV